MTEIHLKPGALSEAQIKSILHSQQACLSLEEDCWQAVSEAKQTIDGILEQDKTVYGINTGFGQLASESIEEDKLKQLQKNLVLSHACGTGPLLSNDIVKLIIVLKINNLAQGYSGVRPSLIKLLMGLVNEGLYPLIYSRGSVGASGDLVPLAHMSVPLLGYGQFNYEDKLIDASEGLKLLGMSQPLSLAPKEGLALLNGMQVSNAIALKALFTIEQLFDTALVSGALSIDAVKGSDVPFDERIHQVRGHKGQLYVAKSLRTLLANSDIRASHYYCGRVQDPYSLRCQPQVMGACYEQIQFAKQILLQEANAVSDNPLVFAKDNDVLSGGNFHGEIIAMACDNLSLAIAEIGALSERRIALLIDGHLSGLPPFLVKEGGLNSGFMLAHVTAASAASDNKALAHPHSVDSLPTSANQEDHVSMATNAALRLFSMIDNVTTILAIELLAAAQGIDFHRPLKTAPLLEGIMTKIRAIVPFWSEDRYFAPDIAKMKTLVKQSDFLEEIIRHES
jgi:histidine ammonia-lyase